MQDEMNDLQEVYTDPNPGDLVRVVRCKDCVYYRDFEGILCCSKTYSVVTDQTDYCSKGVRKDEPSIH